MESDDSLTGETPTFTVQPKAGLPVGTYRENIIVTGSGNANLAVPVSFTVKHNPEKVEAKVATCTEAGNKE